MNRSKSESGHHLPASRLRIAGAVGALASVALIVPGASAFAADGATAAGAIAADLTVNVGQDAEVMPGQRVTYTLSAANHSGHELTHQVLTADLSGVFDDAETAVVGKDEPAVRVAFKDQVVSDLGRLDVSGGGVLTWTGTIPADATLLITDTVAVKDDVAAGAALDAVFQRNGGVEATHLHNPVAGAIAAHLTADVDQDAAVMPGQHVTYTLTATNDGGQGLKGQVLTAGLSGVFDDAEYAKFGDVVVGPTANIGHVEVDDGVLTWKGDVPAGAKVEVTVVVAVKDDVAAGAALDAVFRPMGSTITTHLHNPVSGAIAADLTASVDQDAEVAPGEQVTYTLTAVNVGGQELKGQLLTVDMSGVLDDSEQVHNLSATIGKDHVGTVAAKNGILTWTGDIPAGAKLTIADRVTVKGDAKEGAVLDAVFQPLGSSQATHLLNRVSAAVATDLTAGEAPAAPSPAPKTEPAKAPANAQAANAQAAKAQAAKTEAAKVAAGSRLATTGADMVGAAALATALAGAGALLLTMARRRRQGL